jgi:hypothetical protein
LKEGNKPFGRLQVHTADIIMDHKKGKKMWAGLNWLKMKV